MTDLQYKHLMSATISCLITPSRVNQLYSLENSEATYTTLLCVSTDPICHADLKYVKIFSAAIDHPVADDSPDTMVTNTTASNFCLS